MGALSEVSTVRPSRFRSYGGDLYQCLGSRWRPMDLTDAADLIDLWRAKALDHAGPFQRLGDVFTRDADDLEDALTETRRWRRCMFPSPSDVA